MRLLLPAATTAALLASALPAQVHPHVFAESRLDVVANPDGTVGKLRHLWRFDEVFSSTVLLDFDGNADLKLDDAELREVADTVSHSLAQYNYFQVVTADGVDVAMNPPASFIVDFQDNQLIALFETTPKTPLKLAGTVDFGIYDPTFYTSLDFAQDDHMSVENLPAFCTRKVVRPDPDVAISQNTKTLTAAFFNDPTGTNLSKIFATKLELNCRQG